MRSILFVILFFHSTSYAQDEFIIHGKTDIPDGTLIKLEPIYKMHEGFRDSTEVAKGGFTFQGRLPEPHLYKISAKGRLGFYTILLENLPLNITLRSDSIWKSQQDGLINDLAYSQFLLETSSLTKELNRTYFVMQKLSNSSDSSIAKQIANENRQVQKALRERALSFIKTKNSGLAGLFVIGRLSIVLDSEFLEEGLGGLNEETRDHSLYGSLYSQLMAITLPTIGKKAPEIIQPDDAGKVIKLSDFKDKVILVDFWASWCAPCREEHSNLKAAYDAFNGKGFVILSISLDRLSQKQAWLNAIKKDGLTWTQLSDLKGNKNSAALSYGVGPIPANFLINREGVIVAINLRGSELKNELNKLLK